jgi:chloramphenicol-sensitive protein RarD
MPLYFILIAAVDPVEIVAHRIAWTTVLMLGILTLWKQLGELWATLTQWRTLLPLIASALLIATNWLIYIWAVQNEHVIAASLGYFLNPMINVLLGFAVLKERLSRWQWVAVAIAGVGVGVLAAGALATLWISLILGFSFGLYGLVRKMTPTGAFVGLTVETIILVPAAIAVLAWRSSHGQLDFGQLGWDIDLLLVAAGAITAVPLLLFAFAAQRLPLASLGLVQYIGPTIQFLLGLLLFGEPLTLAHKIAFPLIWVGLAVYSWASLRANRIKPTTS